MVDHPKMKRPGRREKIGRRLPELIVPHRKIRLGSDGSALTKETREVNVPVVVFIMMRDQGITMTGKRLRNQEGIGPGRTDNILMTLIPMNLIRQVGKVPDKSARTDLEDTLPEMYRRTIRVVVVGEAIKTENEAPLVETLARDSVGVLPCTNLVRIPQIIKVIHGGAVPLGPDGDSL